MTLSFRRNDSHYLERDGYAADPEAIFLTAGASAGVSNLLQILIANPSCGVLIPIPQYPLYTATLALYHAHAVPYYLDESEDWSLDVAGLEGIVGKARADGIDVRAIAVIKCAAELAPNLSGLTCW